tara:strand:+ start:1031 stop:1210 length:180 start_codon:yes stop_codon:yes gene_type:complete
MVVATSWINNQWDPIISFLNFKRTSLYNGSQLKWHFTEQQLIKSWDFYPSISGDAEASR